MPAARAYPIRVRRELYLCEDVHAQGCASETAIGVSPREDDRLYFLEANRDEARRLIPDPPLPTRRQRTRVPERRGPIPHAGDVAKRDSDGGAAQVLVATTPARTAASAGRLV